MEVYLASKSFFSNNVWFFLFLLLLCFYFFIKIITTPIRWRNQLRVRSPQFWIWVIHSDYIFPSDSGSLLPSSPRRSGAKLGRFAWGNPLLLGHGLRRCLKNLPTSKWVALATNKSVWQKQIRMASNYSVTFFEKIETSPLSRYFTSPLSVRTTSFASSLISSTKQ